MHWVLYICAVIALLIAAPGSGTSLGNAVMFVIVAISLGAAGALLHTVEQIRDILLRQSRKHDKNPDEESRSLKDFVKDGEK